MSRSLLLAYESQSGTDKTEHQNDKPVFDHPHYLCGPNGVDPVGGVGPLHDDWKPPAHISDSAAMDNACATEPLNGAS